MISNRVDRIFIIAFLIACVLASPTFAQKKLADESINLKVNTELFFQLEVPHEQIEPIVRAGIVTLHGKVNNVLAKEQAGKVARNVKGVVGVINEIEVFPSKRTDLAIRTDIQQALLDNPATEVAEVDVSVIDGIVRLTGTVQSWHEKLLTTYVAKGVRGVRQVVEDIEIRHVEDRVDSEIEKEIESMLFTDIRLYDSPIDIQVENGIVKLSGVVRSSADKQQALHYAWAVGVDSVITEDLKTNDWIENPNFKPKNKLQLTDSEIAQAISTAFSYNPRLNDYEPKVTVDGGIVTLRGVVTNPAARKAAAKAAGNVVGVVVVKNNIKVRPDQIPDNNVLTNRVEAALARDPNLEPYELLVSVWNGVVFLDGMVENNFEKNRAQGVVESVRGVINVVNKLETVNEEGFPDNSVDVSEYYPSPYTSARDYFSADLTDQQIYNNILEEWWWSPVVELDKIKLEVEDGTAVISGNADSWREQQLIVKNAYEGGATKVVNLLEVGE